MKHDVAVMVKSIVKGYYDVNTGKLLLQVAHPLKATNVIRPLLGEKPSDCNV
jgi:hypothetical protein